MLTLFSTLWMLALPLLAMPPHQDLSGLEIPWWVWLVVIFLVLLVLFLGIVMLDWKSSPTQPLENEDE